jgi:hypothetical protein
VFLPALVNPDECKGKSKELNMPLCLAWSSSARNHFIPLVGIEGGEEAHLFYCQYCEAEGQSLGLTSYGCAL